MKLKNFLKKQKKIKKKDKKTFHTSKKFNRKPTRADEKTKSKKNKRVILLTIIGTAIFVFTMLLAVGAYFYNYFLIDRFNSQEIISPGEQYVFEVNNAREIINSSNIDIASLEYSSESGSLTLITSKNTTVYFSDSAELNEQVEILERIIINLESEDRQARTIDFRYNRPIVKF